jgi:DNA repair protein RecO (recombination protein O)
MILLVGGNFVTEDMVTVMTASPLVKVASQWFPWPSMGPSHVSEAIILRSRVYGESDKIVTFLTADVGKLTGIAKGAKNSRRRFANCLDSFTRVRVHFRTRAGASMAFMESCDLLQPAGILSEPTKFAYGSYLIELVDQLTGEAQPVLELYNLLSEGLDELRQGAATPPFLRVFELRLLHDAGYDPQLQSCARCHRALLSLEQVFLEPTEGSFVCTACRAPGQAVIAVTGQTLKILDAIKRASLGEARRRRFTATTATEAAQMMSHLLALHLPRPLRSTKLIADLSS